MSAAEVRVPEVTRTCRPRRISRSTTGMSDEGLADARPVQPGEAAMRALPARDAAPLAEALPVLLAAAHAPQKDRGGDRLERDEAVAIERAAASGRRGLMRRVPRARLSAPRRGRSCRRARRRAHARGRARARRRGGPPRRRRSSASRGDEDRLAEHHGAAAERQAEARAVPVPKSKRRLVTTATGTIGRPESCASMTMPSPQTREIFGMSAVSTTISPSASARTISRVAATPPFSRTSRPRAPEPRMAGRRDAEARSR